MPPPLPVAGTCPAISRYRSGRLPVSTTSLSTTAGEQDLGEGPHDDLDVEPERPVLDVVVVEARTVRDRGVAPQATHLGQTGQPGLHAVPVGVPVVLRGEPVHEVGALG